jgi:predicted phosphodiesterase
LKLLLFSDLHTDTAAAVRLVELSHGVDVVIGAGDFANAHHGISSCINILSQIRVPAILVPGNNESLDALMTACKSRSHAKVLHGSGIEISGQCFFGLGGGIPVTPFGS